MPLDGSEHAAGTPADVSAEEKVLLGVEYGDLGAALGRLSPEMRAVVQVTVLDGLTSREAARLLNVGASTAIRWIDRWRTTGSVDAKPVTGHCRSPLEKHKQW